MALANIRDGRGRKNRSLKIVTIIEPSCQDNCVEDADQFDWDDPNINTGYAQRSGLSLYDAVFWANQFRFPVTLYIYDYEPEMEYCYRQMDDWDHPHALEDGLAIVGRSGAT